MKQGSQEKMFTVIASMLTGLLVALAMIFVGVELLW
jgi:hypothetical protein